MLYNNTELWNYIREYLQTNTFLNIGPTINSHNFIYGNDGYIGFKKFICSTCGLSAIDVIFILSQ